MKGVNLSNFNEVGHTFLSLTSSNGIKVSYDFQKSSCSSYIAMLCLSGRLVKHELSNWIWPWNHPVYYTQNKIMCLKCFKINKKCILCVYSVFKTHICSRICVFIKTLFSMYLFSRVVTLSLTIVGWQTPKKRLTKKFNNAVWIFSSEYFHLVPEEKNSTSIFKS